MSLLLFEHPPAFFVVGMAIMSLLFVALALGDKAVGTGHRIIGLLRAWREFRRGK